MRRLSKVDIVEVETRMRCGHDTEDEQDMHLGSGGDNMGRDWGNSRGDVREASLWLSKHGRTVCGILTFTSGPVPTTSPASQASASWFEEDDFARERMSEVKA